MRLTLDPRARRLIRRVPRTSVYSALEIALLSMLALQCARLVWTLLTPVGPIGDWQAPRVLRPALTSSAELLAGFDPFFRLSGDAGPVVVTSLNLQLFGIREDRATGRGSAIIGTPDGRQRSFLIGEEIVPGVTLAAVAFDSVTINRNGGTEQIFMDQSTPAPVAAPMQSAPAAALAPPVPPVSNISEPVQ